MIRSNLAITLTPEQEAWCKAHVASGGFASVEEAARHLIDERIAERAAEEGDDLAWAKPYADEARAAVARGDTVTLEEPTAEIIAYLAAKAGHDVAASYIASFERLYDRLADHPHTGAPRPALGPHVRIGIVSWPGLDPAIQTPMVGVWMPGSRPGRT